MESWGEEKKGSNLIETEQNFLGQFAQNYNSL